MEPKEELRQIIRESVKGMYGSVHSDDKERIKTRGFIVGTSKDIIKNMDIPKEILTNQENFLELMKEIHAGLYEMAVDNFSSDGSEPDERFVW